jgi:hypothetical protein
MSIFSPKLRTILATVNLFLAGAFLAACLGLEHKVNYAIFNFVTAVMVFFLAKLLNRYNV